MMFLLASLPSAHLRFLYDLPVVRRKAGCHGVLLLISEKDCMLTDIIKAIFTQWHIAFSPHPLFEIRVEHVVGLA